MASAAQTCILKKIKKMHHSDKVLFFQFRKIVHSPLTMVNSKEVYVSYVLIKKVRYSYKGKPMQHLPLVKNRSEAIFFFILLKLLLKFLKFLQNEYVRCNQKRRINVRANDDGEFTLESLTDAVCFLGSILAFYMFH